MLKKTTLAILSLAVSGLAFAGTMGPACVPGNVTIPCEAQKWDFSIQALYLQPLWGSPLNYRIRTTRDRVRFKDISSDWDWGYRLEGSYHFSTGNDISINWFHFNNDNRHGLFNGAFTLLTPQGPLIVPAEYGLRTENRFDQVNAVLGQHFDFDMRKSARIYGGLQYAQIRWDARSTYIISQQVSLATNGVFDFHNTDFSGFGPVMGLDYSYGLTEAFSITANTAASLLYGTSRFNLANNYGNGLVLGSLYSSRKMIVPALDAKLGANYAVPLAQGILNLQAGYQVVNYFDPLQGLWGTTSTDYGLCGAYFGVKWLG